MGLITTFRDELQVYRLVLGHPDTPRTSRWLLGAAVAYAVSPIDLIPDFVPLLGQLDDLLVLPLLVWAALRLVPRQLVRECRDRVSMASGPQALQPADHACLPALRRQGDNGPRARGVGNLGRGQG